MRVSVFIVAGVYCHVGYIRNQKDDKCGKLQYRQNHIHGNPYFRLLRTELESLVKELFGEDHLKEKKL